MGGESLPFQIGEASLIALKEKKAIILSNGEGKA
jgi:hypothetical protein